MAPTVHLPWFLFGGIMLILCSVILLVKFPRLYRGGRLTNRVPRGGSRGPFAWTTLEAGRSSQRYKCRWWRRNKTTSQFSASEVCGICLQTRGNQEHFQRLRCDHVFHTRCVDEWLRQNRVDCPLCKSVHIPHRQNSS